jgi:hypothetical protein
MVRACSRFLASLVIVFILARPQESCRCSSAFRSAPFRCSQSRLDRRCAAAQAAADLDPGASVGDAFLGGHDPTAVVPKLPHTAIEMSILFVLYATIAHGTQKFRTLQSIAGVLAVTCLFITFVCLHQGLAPTECVGGEDMTGEVHGKPDGRLCDTAIDCYGPDAEPELQYRCEHVGLFGTHSVMGRVRYRGELMDPNEVALAINAGALSLLIAFARRKRSSFGVLHAGRHQPRAVHRLVIAWRLSPRCWSSVSTLSGATGVDDGARRRDGTTDPCSAVARTGPGVDAASLRPVQRPRDVHTAVRRVGRRQFAEHHFMTAHNSSALALAELGFMGSCCSSSITSRSRRSWSGSASSRSWTQRSRRCGNGAACVVGRHRVQINNTLPCVPLGMDLSGLPAYCGRALPPVQRA